MITKIHPKCLIVTVFLLMASICAMAQTSISGTVKDRGGDAVIGAGVVQEGTTNGVVTDLDGKFTIRVPEGAKVVVSCIGYKDWTFTVDGRKSYNIVLEEDALALDASKSLHTASRPD